MTSLTSHNPDQKCSFISVIGLPNAGKSTLINRLVGQKISITSRKSQTTRFRVRGIFNEEDTQIILIDTQGIFEAKVRFEKAMVRAAWDGVNEADMTLLIVDTNSPKTIQASLDLCKNLSGTCFLALNKIDKIKKDTLLEITQKFSQAFNFEEIFMISAENGDGVDRLKASLIQNAKPGPWMYEGDQASDISMRLLASEITREHVYDLLHDELPYSILVETERYEVKEDQIHIAQLIYVQRDSQKGIVIGKGGSQLKKIASRSRQDLEEMVSQKVFLEIFVKVKANWQEDSGLYKMLGLEFNLK